MNAVAGILAHGAAMLSKTSICVTLLRIATGYVRTLIWFAVASMNLVLVLSVVFLLVQCRPVEATWNPLIKGNCWPNKVTLRCGVFASGTYSPRYMGLYR
jgi:hypothetical protein